MAIHRKSLDWRMLSTCSTLIRLNKVICSMGIKTRIILTVLLLEMTGYSILIIYSTNKYESDLIAFREQHIASVFRESLFRINTLTQKMQYQARGLAIAGEQFYALRQSVSPPELTNSIQDYLISRFSVFPQSIGGGLWFEPNVFYPDRRYFGPYAFWQQQDVVFSWELNTPSYDYHNQYWYRLAIPKDWELSKPRPKSYYWTPPYYDEAGSKALMMTVDALMHDANEEIIGIATVDWAMTEMTQFIEGIKITPNSYPFLIEKSTAKFVSFPQQPNIVMQSIDTLSWSKEIIETAKVSNSAQRIKTQIEQTPHYIYYVETDVGLVFGVILPESDFTAEVDAIRAESIQGGLIISFAFIILVTLFVGMLFAPFNNILKQIQKSIVINGDNLEVKTIDYQGNNEFAPIISALNKVYEHINSFTTHLLSAKQLAEKNRLMVETLNTELEEKVENRTKQLSERNAEMQQTLEKLTHAKDQLVETEKMASLGGLVAGIAHEINTPVGISVTAASHLNTLVSQANNKFNAGTMTRQDFSRFHEDLLETSNIILSNLQRAAELIKGFKLVAVDQSSGEMKEFNLGHYLQEVIVSLQPSLRKGGHQITLESDENVNIYADPGAFAQIISNLVINSNEHGFNDMRNGLINIHVKREPDAIQIIYSDNGKGIPEEALAKVFEPFYTTRRSHGNSGLGLHIIYNIVTQQLSGTIDCKSEINKGITVTIHVPNGL